MFKFKNILSFSIVVIVISAIILFFIPEKKQSKPVDKIQTLKNLSELATAEYLVTKIVKFSDEKFYGDRKILFETSAVLKAGVDLDALKDNDFVIRNDSISLYLPQPELLSLDMQSDSIKETFAKSSILRKDFSNKDKDEILAAGEKNILENIDGIGIIESAKENTRIFLETWLRLAGFNSVSIYFKEEGDTNKINS